MPIGLIRKVYDRIEPRVSPALERLLRHPLYLKTASKSFELVYRTLLVKKAATRKLLEVANLPTREEQEQLLYQLKKMQYEAQDVKAEMEELKRRVGKAALGEKNDAMQ
jgi:hypothetical protein